MLLVALFSDGGWGVWHVDHAGELQPATATLQACRRHGRVHQLEWLPLPPPLGTGVAVVAALEEGALGVVETWMTALANGEARHRQLHMAVRLGGAWPFQPGASCMSAWGCLPGGACIAIERINRTRGAEQQKQIVFEQILFCSAIWSRMVNTYTCTW